MVPKYTWHEALGYTERKTCHALFAADGTEDAAADTEHPQLSLTQTQTHKAITESGKVAKGGWISSVHMQVLKSHRNP